MLKNKSGITLIALVVTIIVLIILAGISLNLILGENGIIQRAKDSKQQTAIAEYKEKIELIKADVGVKNEGVITLEKLNEALNENSEKSWVNKVETIEVSNKNKIKLTTNEGYVFYITEVETEYKGTGDIIIPDVILADEVTFTPKDSNWKAKDGSDITTIKDALDYFYED